MSLARERAAPSAVWRPKTCPASTCARAVELVRQDALVAEVTELVGDRGADLADLGVLALGPDAEVA